MNDATKNVNIKLPTDLHRELKIFAASQSQTLEAVITNAVQIIIKKDTTNDR